MEDNLFTILCWFLPSININQLSVYIRPLPLEPSSNLLHPTPLGGHRALGWAPCVAQCYSKFPLAICFKYGTVYVSVLLTQFNPPSPSHTVSTSLFFMSLFYSCVVFPPLLPDCTLCRVSFPSSLELLPQYPCPFVFLFTFYSFFMVQVMFHCQVS